MHRSGRPPHSFGLRHSRVSKGTSLPCRSGAQQIASPGQSPESSHCMATMPWRVPHAARSESSDGDDGAGLQAKWCGPAPRCASQQISLGTLQVDPPQAIVAAGALAEGAGASVGVTGVLAAARALVAEAKAGAGVALALARPAAVEAFCPLSSHAA